MVQCVLMFGILFQDFEYPFFFPSQVIVAIQPRLRVTIVGVMSQYLLDIKNKA